MFTGTPQIELQSNSYLVSRAKSWMPPVDVELRRAWFVDAACPDPSSAATEFGGVDVTAQLARCFSASPTAIVFDEATLLRHVVPADCGDAIATAVFEPEQRKVLLVETTRKQDRPTTSHQSSGQGGSLGSPEPLVELIRLDATEQTPITYFYPDIGDRGASLVDRVLQSDHVARPTASELVASLSVHALSEDDALLTALAEKDAALAEKDGALALALAQIEQLRGERAPASS